MWSQAGKVFDKIISALAALAGVIMVLVTLGVTADVTMRYLFNKPITWMLEITEYSLLYMTFLGTAWVLKREAHVKVDIILNKLNPRNQARVNTATSIIAAMALAVLVYFTAGSTWTYYKSHYYLPTPLETQLYLVLGIIPLGSFMLFVQLLRRAYHNFMIARQSD